MPLKRQVLEELKRNELIAAVERFELPVADKRVRNLLIDALASSRKAKLTEILGDLKRDRLKELCRAFGLDDGGREKAVIAERLAEKRPTAARSDAPKGASARGARRQSGRKSGRRAPERSTPTSHHSKTNSRGYSVITGDLKSNHIVIHRLRTNQPLTEADLQGLETTLIEIGEEDGKTLLSGLLARSEAPSLVYFVRGLVGLDRAAAQSAFSDFLNDESLTPQQIRFVEMVIDQLTARGVMTASALYEPPFSNLHAEGPDALFGGKENVIEGIFEKLKAVQSELIAKAG